MRRDAVVALNFALMALENSAASMPMDTRDPVALLGARFECAIRAAFAGLEGAVDPLIAPAKNPAHGDFQCNAAMGLAKRAGVMIDGKPAGNPRAVALELVKQLAGDTALAAIAEPVTEASVAGPGFINIRLRGEALGGLVAGLDTAELGVVKAAEPQTVVVDLMGVNLAKEMHVGHLRSPIIGDAIARTLERLGHRVVRQNHVGDWGLPIAMVTAKIIRDVAAGVIALERLTLPMLDKAYVRAQLECQRDQDGLAAVRKYGLGPKAEAELEEQVNGATAAFTNARETLLKLQTGDPATRAVWERIAHITMSECVATCARLHVNVTHEHSAGESSYAEELAPMVAELEAKGVAEADQGALIVRLDTPPAGADGEPLWEPIKEPCLIRKTDGGYLYATTDVAAVRRRVRKKGAHRLVYAIDARQSLHMKQVFATALKAGYAFHPQTGQPARMQHAAFGAILGEDGRPFKTRSGENVKLASLLDETVARARAAVNSRPRDAALPEQEATAIAEAVGIAALKYADLSTDRIKDYVFSFDRMLAFEGNTGPYLLYALTRIRSIFRKAQERGLAEASDLGAGGLSDAVLRIEHPAEKTLALALLRYPGVLTSVAESLEPHRLCQYLYDLAQAFSTFYDARPILPEPDAGVRRGLLRLCAITARVLEDGLKTLGLPRVERM